MLYIKAIHDNGLALITFPGYRKGNGLYGLASVTLPGWKKGCGSICYEQSIFMIMKMALNTFPEYKKGNGIF